MPVIVGTYSSHFSHFPPPVTLLTPSRAGREEGEPQASRFTVLHLPQTGPGRNRRGPEDRWAWTSGPAPLGVTPLPEMEDAPGDGGSASCGGRPVWPVSVGPWWSRRLSGGRGGARSRGPRRRGSGRRPD